MKERSFIVYRIWYGDDIVYVGRTKQPLQDRIRGHLFQKPMHRSIDINLVSRIEYAELSTEADMNLYEIYYILTLHPPRNVDDKTPDSPTVTLPELEWKLFTTTLWSKWKKQLVARDAAYVNAYNRTKQISEEISILRKQRHDKDISEETYQKEIERLYEERERLSEQLL